MAAEKSATVAVTNGSLVIPNAGRVQVGPSSLQGMRKMATVEQFLASLRRHVGERESPPPTNKNPFSAALGRPPEAWCADFVVACAREGGLKLPSESASTTTLADAFKVAGRWFHDPWPGDLGFVDFPKDNTFGIQHVL